MAQPLATNIATDGEVIGEGSGLDFSSLLPMVIEKFIAVIEAALVVVGALILMRFVRSKLRAMETQHEQQRNAINLLEKITSGFIVVVSITVSLKIVGIDMTLLVSVAILGLSYGLQDIIKNYVAGILILFKAPFKIGDIVKIRDFTGKVNKMDFQSTSLETFDNRHITIYNSDVMTQSIVNYSNNSIRRLEMNVILGYGSDTDKALKVFDSILRGNPHVLQIPKFSIVFKKFDESGATFVLKFWVQRPCNILKIRTEIATLIMNSFDDQSVFVPYTKAIETDNEAGLADLTGQRKQRIDSFYQMPLFAGLNRAAEAAAQGVPGQPEVPADGSGISTVQDAPDFEEPE